MFGNYLLGLYVAWGSFQPRACLGFRALRPWNWDPTAKVLSAPVSKDRPVSLAIWTLPGTEADATIRFDEQRELCEQTWRETLDAGITLRIPEKRVDDAWRALTASLFLLANGDQLFYSAQNDYQRLFVGECGDAARSLLLFGHRQAAEEMFAPILGHHQAGIEAYDAASKIQLLTHHYWLTRDPTLLKSTEAIWREGLIRLRTRSSESGLLPPESYCGDIGTKVDNLSSNANAWMAIRGLGAALPRAIPEAGALGESLSAEAREFRTTIHDAVRKNIVQESDRPAFVPVALNSELERQLPLHLTETMQGSYWILMAPYVLGTGALARPEEDAILTTLWQRGGLGLGMLRFHQHSGLFANEDALDDLYTLRYFLTLLRRDEVDLALVGFYGKLLHGLTPETCIGAEGTGLRSADGFGRPMYLPPNCASQALFLWMIRYLLVQEWDKDDDGEPDTLQLLFGTPRDWLRDGAVLEIGQAPSMFGELGVRVESRLKRGEIVVEVAMPQIQPRHTRLRLRVADGWEVHEATIAGEQLLPDIHATFDLTGRTGKFTMHVRVDAK